MNYTTEGSAEKLALTYNEAGRALGLSSRTIFALVARGELRAVRIGRSVRIAREELERYVRERQVVPHE